MFRQWFSDEDGERWIDSDILKWRIILKLISVIYPLVHPSIFLSACVFLQASIHPSFHRSLDLCFDLLIHVPIPSSLTILQPRYLSLSPVLSSFIYIYISLISIFFFHPLPIFLNFFSIHPCHISISSFLSLSLQFLLSFTTHLSNLPEFLHFTRCFFPFVSVALSWLLKNSSFLSLISYFHFYLLFYFYLFYISGLFDFIFIYSFAFLLNNITICLTDLFIKAFSHLPCFVFVYTSRCVDFPLLLIPSILPSIPRVQLNT